MDKKEKQKVTVNDMIRVDETIDISSAAVVSHYKFTACEGREYIHKIPMIVNDIMSILIKVAPNEKFDILYIVNYDKYSTASYMKVAVINAVLEKYKNKKNVIICTDAYVSTTEFSPECYYDASEPWKKACDEEHKMPLTADIVKSVLDRDSKMLSELGFININNYVCYETKVAFLYANETSRPIIDAIQATILDSENEEGSKSDD